MSRVTISDIPADIPEEESILGRPAGSATREEQSILGDIQESEMILEALATRGLPAVSGGDGDGGDVGVKDTLLADALVRKKSDNSTVTPPTPYAEGHYHYKGCPLDTSTDHHRNDCGCNVIVVEHSKMLLGQANASKGRRRD
jgi:hypothetical protein